MTEAVPDRPRRPAPSSWRLWWGLLVAAGVLYLATAQRGPAWQDSGLFQWRMHTADWDGHMGLALAHPLLIALGRAAERVPLGSVFWRMNAVSALAAAVAVANLGLLVRRLGPSGRIGPLFAAGAFALAHTPWWLATITESHAVLAALLSGELLVLTSLLARPRLSMAALLGLLNGLGLAVHNLALLAAPAYGLAVVLLAARRRLRWPAVPLFVAGWAAGASPLLVLVAAQALRTTLPAALASALTGGRSFAALASAPKAAALGLGYVLYNFPNACLPLAAVGLWRLRRRAGAPLAAAVAWLLAAHLLFALTHNVRDQFMFFVPLYLLLSLAAGAALAELGAGRRWLRVVALASLAVGPVAYALAPRAVRAAELPLPGRERTLPRRDHARYWLTPWKHDEDSAGQFAAAALAQLGELEGPAILFADGTSLWPLRWTRELAGGPPGDVRLVGTGGGLAARLARDPRAFWREVRDTGASVWVVSNVPGYFPAPLAGRVAEERTGVLYRVRTPPE